MDEPRLDAARAEHPLYDSGGTLAKSTCSAAAQSHESAIECHGNAYPASATSDMPTQFDGAHHVHSISLCNNLPTIQEEGPTAEADGSLDKSKGCVSKQSHESGIECAQNVSPATTTSPEVPPDVAYVMDFAKSLKTGLMLRC